ncbi:MAG TPA: hypothetical protein DCG69_00540 [Bacteroidales bacterium]|nr:hypothetical protein [Bacteroidales bacterium]
MNAQSQTVRTLGYCKTSKLIRFLDRIGSFLVKFRFKMMFFIEKNENKAALILPICLENSVIIQNE